MRLQRDSYAPKSCAFDAANVQFLRAHLCKSHPVLQQQAKTAAVPFFFVCSRYPATWPMQRAFIIFPLFRARLGVLSVLTTTLSGRISHV